MATKHFEISRPPIRRFRRLLVANRGEIAIRIISTAREIGLETFAIFTPDDASHTNGAAHALELKSAASYMNVGELVELVRAHLIDAVHPGYGFLSESAEFALRMWQEANAVVVGPGWDILSRTGDKLRARRLANECNVPLIPALEEPTSDIAVMMKFATVTGYPVMLKAVDGGGGRGIRLVQKEEEMRNAVKSAIADSPSHQIFAEKAAIDGYRHIEVQIVGDGQGNVCHVWERECSIQRRYQKVVEFAPSSVRDRGLIGRVISDALKMAHKISYFSLGTFEFLVNPNTKEYYFLEVNPRLQVEHTITEAISSLDLVKVQLLLSQGASLVQAGLMPCGTSFELPPRLLHSIQLRITAENVSKNWSLSVGKISAFTLPSGNGIRIDSGLRHGEPQQVGSDFDSLLAKVIVTAPSWTDAVQKAKRALEDTTIFGIQTNIGVLKAIISHADFAARKCDTRWLEARQAELVAQAAQNSRATGSVLTQSIPSDSSLILAGKEPNVLLRKGDAWSISVSPVVDKISKDSSKSGLAGLKHQLQISQIRRNDFPSRLTAEVLMTAPTDKQGVLCMLDLVSTTTSGDSTAIPSQQRRAQAHDPSNVAIPFSGKLVEVVVEEGDLVEEDAVICVVQQMKMELEVRSPRAGRVTWVIQAEEGAMISEGSLAAVVEPEQQSKL